MYTLTCGLSYKTFYGRNLRIFAISYSVWPCKLFQTILTNTLRKFVNYRQKSFITLAPAVEVVKLSPCDPESEGSVPWSGMRQQWKNVMFSSKNIRFNEFAQIVTQFLLLSSFVGLVQSLATKSRDLLSFKPTSFHWHFISMIYLSI